MDPQRKRKTRLIVMLSTALLLAVALIYTSFTAATVAKTPSQLLCAIDTGQSAKDQDKSYELTGKVVDGSIRKNKRPVVGAEGKYEQVLEFQVRDREGTKAIDVQYRGTVPDPFREGREVIVTGQIIGDKFIAKRDSLITKCPSKFTKEPTAATSAQ